MKAKTYNKKLLWTIGTILSIISIFNIVVDPYNIFNFKPIKNFNYYKPEIKRQERLTKFLSLKTTNHADTIFVGTSRTDWSLEYDYYNKITNKKSYNMAMNGMNYVEMKDIVRKAVNIHPEIKTVLFSCDYILEAEEDDGQNKLDIKDNDKYIKINEIAPIMFSLDTTVSSVTTIIKNIVTTDKKRYVYNGVKKPFVNHNIQESFEDMIGGYATTGKTLKIEDVDFDDLKSFIKEMKNQGVEIVLYMPPTHVTLFEILDKNNAWNKIDLMKEKLAEVQPFYDFMYMNEINTDTVKPDMKYFFETSHATCYTGRMILDKIFQNKGDYGVFVTKDNVKSHNLQNRKDLKQWQKSNTDTVKWVHDVMNSKGEN